VRMGFGLDDVDAIAEGVVNEAAPHAWVAVVPLDRRAVGADARRELIETAYPQCRMSLRRRTEVGIYAQAQLDVAGPEPGAAVRGRRGRRLHLAEAEDAGVELASAVLAAWRHGEQDVVDGGGSHGYTREARTVTWPG